MKHSRFEELAVWKAAIELAVQMHALAAKPAFKGNGSLRDQVERAAVSISNNTAEGLERGTTQELLTFLYIARGSAGEVRSMLSLFEQLSEFADRKFEIPNLKSQAESISRQLRAWADALLESSIKGQRFLTEKARKSKQATSDREEFLERLREIQEGGAEQSG